MPAPSLFLPSPITATVMLHYLKSLMVGAASPPTLLTNFELVGVSLGIIGSTIGGIKAWNNWMTRHDDRRRTQDAIEGAPGVTSIVQRAVLLEQRVAHLEEVEGKVNHISRRVEEMGRTLAEAIRLLHRIIANTAPGDPPPPHPAAVSVQEELRNIQEKLATLLGRLDHDRPSGDHGDQEH